jgi:hypothetical protein
MDRPSLDDHPAKVVETTPQRDEGIAILGKMENCLIL